MFENASKKAQMTSLVACPSVFYYPGIFFSLLCTKQQFAQYCHRWLGGPVTQRSAVELGNWCCTYHFVKSIHQIFDLFYHL